jgi:hypothetical protein
MYFYVKHFCIYIYMDVSFKIIYIIQLNNNAYLINMFLIYLKYENFLPG